MLEVKDIGIGSRRRVLQCFQIHPPWCSLLLETDKLSVILEDCCLIWSYDHISQNLSLIHVCKWMNNTQKPSWRNSISWMCEHPFQAQTLIPKLAAVSFLLPAEWLFSPTPIESSSQFFWVFWDLAAVIAEHFKASGASVCLAKLKAKENVIVCLRQTRKWNSLSMGKQQRDVWNTSNSKSMQRQKSFLLLLFLGFGIKGFQKYQFHENQYRLSSSLGFWEHPQKIFWVGSSRDMLNRKHGFRIHWII